MWWSPEWASLARTARTRRPLLSTGAVQGFGFRVLGFRVLGFRVLGFRGLGCRV